MTFTQHPTTFFIGLSGIELPTIGHPGFKIGPELKITNDKDFISRLVGSYRLSTGTIEQNHLINFATALIYSREKILIPDNGQAEAMNRLIINRLAEVQNWLMKIWLIKDNAIDPDIGWMAIDGSNPQNVSNNRWGNFYSRADGTNNSTKFTKEDLQSASKFPILPDNFNSETPVQIGVSGVSETRTTKLSHESPRLQRFLYYINAARAVKDVAIKIAHYCSALETIVSTSHSELTHQVSERVAILLRDKGEDQLEIFRQVKTAYGIRSKAVHGAAFRDKEHENLIKSSIEIDRICREISIICFENEEFIESIGKNTEAFNEYWMKKIFVN